MGLTVKELKALLEQLPDDALVAVPAYPINYRPVHRAVAQTLYKLDDTALARTERLGTSGSVDAIVLS